MQAQRVVVTGLGPVTPIGVGARAFHAAQLDCANGIRRITSFDPAAMSVTIAGEVDLPAGLAPDSRELVSDDRCTHLTLAAAKLAISDSGLDLAREDLSRIAVVIGTGVGGVGTWEDNTRLGLERGERGVRARFIPMAMANSPAARVSIEHGLLGPSQTVVAACASGAEAIATAALLIRAGEADVVLAGGAEAPIIETTLAGFARMRALSTRCAEPARASRPFSLDRDGFVMGEGAAVLVLESAERAAARQAHVYAELAGYGRTCDAFHLTMPKPQGEGASEAIRIALRSADLAAADLSYVNAHGTGTSYNDAAEARALAGALGGVAATVPVSATKSMTGHGLGAAGAIEAIASVQAISSGLIPPTANLDHPDPALELDVVGDKPREADVRVVLSNSFAFGGHNIALVFSRYE
ncbi:MAG TPA: beta-ketoacyl-[acyl-carrier-protein] synthase family protein [Pilimelia sp.]|nr:beta-ketoacyl-[acyl-carrier-protein] synthase family protein [Pilimelia sp.]